MGPARLGSLIWLTHKAASLPAVAIRAYYGITIASGREWRNRQTHRPEEPAAADAWPVRFPSSRTSTAVPCWLREVVLSQRPSPLSRLGPFLVDPHLSHGGTIPIRAETGCVNSAGIRFARWRSRSIAPTAYPASPGCCDRTGEFYQHTQRRYDDTSILVAEMCEWGYETGRGKAALERMNWAHGHFKIANDDFLYVLSTFIYEPIRWIDAFGWRPTCRNERLAYYYFWREIGTRMGIADIPPSYEAFEAWSRDYERAQFRFADTNQRIGSATRDLFAVVVSALRERRWCATASTRCSTTR